MVKIPKPKYPYSVELAYFRDFNGQLQDWIKYLVKQLENARIIRRDDIEDDIYNEAQAVWYKIANDTMKLSLAKYFDDTRSINGISFSNQMNAALKNKSMTTKMNAAIKSSGQLDLFNQPQQRAVNVFKSESWLKEELETNFIKGNVALIKNVGDTVAQRIELAVLDAVETGKGYRELTKEIQKISEYGKDRARLISVDQIGKLNGNITKARFQRIGLEAYIWYTSGDNRVRPDHALKNNTKRLWIHDPIPGSEVRCRCVAGIDTVDLDKWLDE